MAQALLIQILIQLSAASVIGDSYFHIYSIDEYSITTTVNNSNAYADYKFTFLSEHLFEDGADLVIKFPVQYPSGLGISTPKCGSYTCVVSGWTVTVSYTGTISNLYRNEVEVKGVLNPPVVGGTGNFELSIEKWGQVVEQNIMFGVLGITQSIGSMTHGVVEFPKEVSHRAGDASYYDLIFRTERGFAANSWLRITFPEQIPVSGEVSCKAVEYDYYTLPGTISCNSASNNIVDVTGISQDIPPETFISIRFPVTNPNRAGFIGNFSIEIGQQNTNTVYEREYGILGLQILPNFLTAVSLAAVDSSIVLATDKQVLYRLSFTTANPIPENGFIEITLNNNLSIDNAYIYHINSGLNDKAFNNLIKLSYDSTTKIITISNFSTVPANQIVTIDMQLTNSGTKGVTMPIIIQTFDTDHTTLIDYNYNDAFVYIQDFGAPVYTPSFTSYIANGANIDFSVKIWPNIEIPVNGYVKIKFPAEFTLVTPLNCFLTPKIKSTVAAQACTAQGQLVTIQLPSTANYEFLPTLDSIIAMNNCINAPTTADYYIFDLSTYNQLDEMLESTNFTFYFTPTNHASATITPFHKTIDVINMFTVQFSPTVAVPSGEIPSDLSELYGWIDLEFTTRTVLDVDIYDTQLGVGLNVGDMVECNHGQDLIPAPAQSSILCIVTSIPSTPAYGSPVIIRVYNFGYITSGETIEIELRYLKGPVATGVAADLRIVTYKRQDHVQYTINTITTQVTYTYTKPATTTDTSTSFTLANSKVGELTDLTFSYTLAGMTGSSPDKIILIFTRVHEQMYCSDTFTCEIDSVAYSCVCMKDRMLVYFDTAGNLSNGSRVFKLGNVQSPTSISLDPDQITIYVIDGDQVKTIQLLEKGIQQTPGTVTELSQKVSQFAMNYPYTVYDFNFMTEHLPPSDGYIELLFPYQYDIIYSDPSPTCKAKELGSNATCLVDGNYIKITNFDQYDNRQPIGVIITGVKNPVVTVGNFRYSTYDSQLRLIDQATYGPDFVFNGTFSPGYVNFHYCRSFPSNGNVHADLDIAFSVDVPIPPGGKLYILLPANSFGNIVETTQCRVSGAIKSFQSCLISGQMAILTINELLDEADILHVHINNVLNPTQGETLGVQVEVEYDNVLINIPKPQDDSRLGNFITTAEPYQLVVDSLDFYPQNEGESATYIFTITPQFDVSSSETLSIIFPEQFDIALGKNMKCWSSELQGDLQCEIQYARIFDISNFYSFSACDTCKITLYITGIINPSYNQGAKTGTFKAGFRIEDHFTQYNEDIGSVQFLQPPGLIDIQKITLENNYARRVNQFTYDFTTQNYIPTTLNQGQVWINYPDTFNLRNSKPFCLSTYTWAEGYPSCYVDIQNVIISGQTTSITGALQVTTDQIPNPLDNIEIVDIKVKTYSGVQKRVLDRSYFNVSPFRFNFEYPGPIFRINNDKPIKIQAGTLSDFIPVSFDYPCALNMTLVPDIQDFQFLPYGIQLFVGDLVSYFRIGVSINQAAGVHYIKWQVFGELDSPFYSNIIDTEIIIVRGEKRKVSIGEIPILPVGGISLPVKVSLQTAPDSALTVTISLYYSGYGIQISTESLIFNTGETERAFSILLSSDTDLLDGTDPILYFSILNSNRHSFYLEQTSKTFQITKDVGVLQGEVVNARVNEIKKTTAKMSVEVNTPCKLIYVTALKGTRAVELEDVKARNAPDFDTTETSYHFDYIYSSRYKEIILTGLSAEMGYSVFVWAEDMLGRSNSEPVIIEFDTQQRYVPAYTDILFLNSFVNGDDETDTEFALQVLLSVPDWRIVRRTTSSRRLVGGVLSYYIADDMNNDNYMRPVDMLKRLDVHRNYFKMLLPGWDSSQDLYFYESRPQGCTFDLLPTIGQDTQYNAISVQSSLEQAGYIYVIAVQQEGDARIISSTQVYRGTNQYNEPALAGSLDVTALQIANITFTDLNPDTSYNLYITCANDFPGSVRLSKSVITLNWKTAPKPQPGPLDLDFSSILTATLLFLFLI